MSRREILVTVDAKEGWSDAQVLDDVLACLTMASRRLCHDIVGLVVLPPEEA